MKEITIYKNSLNTVPMRLWTAEEMNFFFALITQMRGKGTDTVTFDKYQLKEFADYTNRNGSDFKQTMKNLANKLDSMRYFEETSNSFKLMTLFSRFEANWENDLSTMNFTVQVSQNFEYIVNKIKGNFTKFELQEFTNLRSTYAKTLYRHIKQYRTNGKIRGYEHGEIPKDVLFEMLAVPKSMKRASAFKKYVIIPCLKELSPLFAGLKFTPVKKRSAGNPIIAYAITWKQEASRGDWREGNPYPTKKKTKVAESVEALDMLDDTWGPTTPDYWQGSLEEAKLREGLANDKRIYD